MNRITIPLTDEQLETINLAASLRFKDKNPSPKVLSLLFYELSRQLVQLSKEDETPFFHIKISRPEQKKTLEFITEKNELMWGYYLGYDEEKKEHWFEEKPGSSTYNNVKYWRYFTPPVGIKTHLEVKG